MPLYNFSAGPAMLPPEVLQIAAAEMSNWHGSGMSVMEMSHRDPEFGRILKTAQDDLRELLKIPNDYAVLFLQGGGLGENAIVPLNLLGRAPDATIDFIHTGGWSGKSIEEARRYGTVNVAASPKDSGFTRIPERAKWALSDHPAYVHICTNETIHGVEFQVAPDVGKRVLVADMSSHILSRVIDVTNYGVIFAGAQKNIGPAGLTLAIVRRDLLGHALPICPTVFDWAQQAANDSMVNTPPTYAIYIAGLVFQWLKRQGGVAAIEARNIEKSQRLYDFLDASECYENRVEPNCRSRMNVPFFLRDESKNAAFLEGAKARGLLQLKGHKSVGGMRASIYNAMPLAGVEALIAYLQDFERHCG